MARDPGSVWAPLPEAGAPDGMVKDAVIVHSTGDNGTAAATRRFFELAGTVTESTFIIGWGPEDPTLQIMDSTDIADANVSANRRAIAIEVVGDGKSGYNAWQRRELLRIIRWCMATHPGIAARICRTATDAGLGWHIMFGAPGPWAAVAKICPGPVRIQELKNDIFPAIFAGGTGQEDDMPDINEISVVVRDWSPSAVTAQTIDWGTHKTSVAQQTADNAKMLVSIQAQLGATIELIRQLASREVTSGGVDLAAIEAAAKRGADEALDGFQATVVISNPDDEPA